MKIGNLETYGIIYKIHNKVNGKVYIGQTISKYGFNGRYCFKGNGIERVYNYYKGSIRYNESYNTYLFNSIKKYGFGAFDVNEIFDVAFSLNELNLKEECWIKFYNSTDKKFGYNFRYGGDNCECNEESKVRYGVGLICIDDGKEFKSIQEATRYYDLPVNWIKSTFRKKHSFDNFKNESKMFRKKKRDLKHNERLCTICGRIMKKNSTSHKYCKNCGIEVAKSNRKKTEIHINTDNVYIPRKFKIK